MVWHVEDQNTLITVCAGKKRRKGFLRVSVVEKAQSKPKHQNHSFFPFFPFFQNTMSSPINYSSANPYKRIKLERETRRPQRL